MTISTKDKNRAALVQTIINQNGGKIFTVIAKRKKTKISYVNEITAESITQAQFNKLDNSEVLLYKRSEENFMTMTCRTGVTKELKGGKSTIRDTPDLVSVNLTNGQGYRCFSAFNVLQLRASGTVITFNEQDVLAFTGE